ncbi:MAG: ATP-binding protein [Acidobacteria bacterium]|nr:ATP-binding protein [Acidobacteriota bacterium]
MQEMIERHLKPLLQERLASSPAVAIIGPRQCGKTTLSRTFPGRYFDLEQEPERLRLDLEWDDVSRSGDMVILDEAQAWPGIFPRLRGAIDADRRRNGRFLILGSVSPALMANVSESLAGRLSLTELTPFLWPELTATEQGRLWLCGGYPDGGASDSTRYPQWQKDYLALLTQRDLPGWGLPAKPQTTTRLLKMLAAVHGESWNASQLGQSLGLDYKTVNSYVDYLVGAFLIRRLPAYQANVRKRLIRSPKVYWRDSGLLHAVMNVTDERASLVQPWIGKSWEGFVIEQILGAASMWGLHLEAYWFRTSDQYELDLVLDFGGELWAIEVKLTSSPGRADMDRLNFAADLIGARRRFLISKTSEVAGDELRASCNLGWFLKLMRFHSPRS